MPSHLDRHTGREVGGIVRESSSFALRANLEAHRWLDLYLDPPLERERKCIKARSEIGRAGGGAGEHAITLRVR